MDKQIVETICEDYGICCCSCQEDVNVNRCEECLQRFEDGDKIICEHKWGRDSTHWHKECYTNSQNGKEQD